MRQLETSHIRSLKVVTGKIEYCNYLGISGFEFEICNQLIFTMVIQLFILQKSMYQQDRSRFYYHGVNHLYDQLDPSHATSSLDIQLQQKPALRW